MLKYSHNYRFDACFHCIKIFTSRFIFDIFSVSLIIPESLCEFAQEKRTMPHNIPSVFL